MLRVLDGYAAPGASDDAWPSRDAATRPHLFLSAGLKGPAGGAALGRDLHWVAASLAGGGGAGGGEFASDVFHAPIAKPKPPPAAAAPDGGKGGEKGGEKGGDGAQQWAFSVEDKDGQVWELRAESEHDFYVWSQQLRAWRAGESSSR